MATIGGVSARPARGVAAAAGVADSAAGAGAAGVARHDVAGAGMFVGMLVGMFAGMLFVAFVAAFVVDRGAAGACDGDGERDGPDSCGFGDGAGPSARSTRWMRRRSSAPPATAPSRPRVGVFTASSAPAPSAS